MSGRVVVIAPARTQRPGAPRPRLEPLTKAELESCPFCEGRESRTPPETLALGRGAGEPDTPGWAVRVVPNLYPALEFQEVVVHTPRHARSLAELSDDEIGLVAEAWQRRAAERRGLYVHAIVNEGGAAGSSLPHTHSQLVWLADTPPEAARELAHAGHGCPLCVLRGDRELVVLERAGVALRSSWAGRVPYELLVAPLEHETDPWTSGRLVTALQLVAESLRRLHVLEGPSPANVWLHAAGHWHLEVVPRLTVLAGIELGAGLFINSLAPEQAAEALRAVS